MDQHDILAIIQNGEDSRHQFKKDVESPQSLAAEIVAFANSRGGRLYLGVDDTGRVWGLTSERIRALNQMISNVASELVKPALSPYTEIVTLEGKSVLVLEVPEGIDKPYADQDGRYWVKSGADKRKAVREEVQRMFHAARKVSVEEEAVAGSSLGDIDSGAFKKFFSDYHGVSVDAAGLPIMQLLQNKKLAKEDEITLVGMLLFGQRFESFPRPCFMLKAVSFFGTDVAGNQYRDREDIQGNIISLFKGAMDFCRRNLRKIQGGKSFNSPGRLEVSAASLEEALVNALVHRDYGISASIRLFLFDDRIEIISPGKLPNNLTVENIKAGTSVPRNPILNSFAAKLLPYTGIGSGIRRILHEQPDAAFENEVERGLFIVTVPRPTNI